MTLDLASLQSLWHLGMPLWVLCGGALACLLVDSIWPKKLSALVYAVGLVALFASLGVCYLYWINPSAQPQSDLLVVDHLTLSVFGLTLIVGIMTMLNALSYIKLHSTLTSEFCSLLLFSLVGMGFLVASNHLFMNFIGLETMSMAIYVLVGSHKQNIKSNEASVKYFIMGSVASAIFLYGVVLFYGSFGTLKLDLLSMNLTADRLDFLKYLALGFILVGLFFKLAIVPFHHWAPDVYEGAPAPVTGFMAAAVKMAVVGFALRLFMVFELLDQRQFHILLNTFVVLSFFVANLLAAKQDDVKRTLAYSSIAHAGFLLFGLLAGYKDGQYQTSNIYIILYYLLGYLVMTMGAFGVLSLLTKDRGEATSFSDLKGLGKSHPVLASVFSLFMIGMLGLPGTVGFLAKYGVLSMAVENGHIALALIAMLASVISVFYYLRPSVMMFFYEPVGTSPIRAIPTPSLIALTICTFLVVYLGLFPQTLLIKFAQIGVSPLAP